MACSVFWKRSPVVRRVIGLVHKCVCIVGNYGVLVAKQYITYVLFGCRLHFERQWIVNSCQASSCNVTKKGSRGERKKGRRSVAASWAACAEYARMIDSRGQGVSFYRRYIAQTRMFMQPVQRYAVNSILLHPSLS